MLLIDEQLPPALAPYLTELGLDSGHARDLDPHESTHESFWLIAASKGWIVMTKDSDFLQIAMASRHGRVILVGIGNAPTKALRTYLQDHLPRIRQFVASKARVLALPKAT